MAATMNVGEYGKSLNLNANYTMSAYTALSIVVTRPDDTTFTRTNPAVTISATPLVTEDAGTFAANKYAIYLVQNGDLTVPGEYTVRLSYTDTDKHLIAGAASFMVNE